MEFAIITGPEVLFVAIIFWALPAVVGYYIGKRKGRAVLGAVLGLFLSWVGWIIIALLPKATPPPT